MRVGLSEDSNYLPCKLQRPPGGWKLTSIHGVEGAGESKGACVGSICACARPCLH